MILYVKRYKFPNEENTIDSKNIIYEQNKKSN